MSAESILALIRRANGHSVFRAGTAETNRLVNDLARALSELTKGDRPRLDDESAMRRAIDDDPWHALRMWADLLEEQGNPDTAEGLRWLADCGKWPGAVSPGRYRWMPDKPGFPNTATWSLPAGAIDLAAALSPRKPGLKPGEYPTVTEALAAAARGLAAWMKHEATKKANLREVLGDEELI